MKPQNNVKCLWFYKVSFIFSPDSVTVLC